MEKSSGVFFRDPPASYQEHVERVLIAHLKRKQNTTVAGNDLGSCEKTARNWINGGPPRGVIKFAEYLKKNPELIHQLFGGEQVAP